MYFILKLIFSSLIWKGLLDTPAMPVTDWILRMDWLTTFSTGSWCYFALGRVKAEEIASNILWRNVSIFLTFSSNLSVVWIAHSHVHCLKISSRGSQETQKREANQKASDNPQFTEGRRQKRRTKVAIPVSKSITYIKILAWHRQIDVRLFFDFLFCVTLVCLCQNFETW